MITWQIALAVALLAADCSAAGCTLPEQPNNGKYLLGGCNPPKCQQPLPGTSVESAALHYTCEPGSTLSGSPVVFCDQQWLSPFPTCTPQNSAQRCRPLISTSHEISCSSSGREVRCNQPMASQTKATVKCKNSYEVPSQEKNNYEITCNRNGLWSQPLFPCTSECGLFDFEEYESASGTARNTPWYAAVMKKDWKGSWQFACSATIISPRTLVSVAQCVWKELDKKVLSADNFAVIIGKYENGPKAVDSKNAQQILVDKIYLTETFRGYERRYEEDISLFILKSDIRMNEVTRPICVDFDNKYESYFVPGKLGIIASWGEPVDRTNKLQVRLLPVVEYEECLRNIPIEFHSYLTYDKFCAGILKKKTVCKGDSGVGYANQFKDGKWYLTGIASVGVNPSEGESCESNYYKGFTRVSLFLSFIKKYLAGVGPSLPACKDNEFQCASSECVESLHLCDGSKHCSDGSDETHEQCHLLKCPGTSFQCRYGACIDKKSVCNGANECVDGSDEDPALCKNNGSPSTPFCSSGCRLPKQPNNGYYTFIGCMANSELVPDSIVSAGVVLNFSCNPGFLLSGPSLLACNENWSSHPPSCNPVFCKPLINPTRDIICSLNNEDVDCTSKTVKAGTKALVKCKSNYESIPGLKTYDTICESNGRWNRELQSCIPKCGIPNTRGIPLISLGRPALVAEFPWHVGLYQALENGTLIPSCGGTIVSPYVVVSAAHCFWKSGEVSWDEYKAVAGKYFYAWDQKTNYVQHLEIKDVILPRDYSGPGRHYSNDIAIIILKYRLHINEAVRPVCIDYEKEYLNYFSPLRTIGNVTGWGLNEQQSFSEVLNVANLPYVDNDECEQNTPKEFHSYLTYDKFCAGNRNKTAVCQGDSGGGYTVRFRDGRSYLVGIVSAGPNAKCGQYPYAVFTNIYHHLELVRKYVFKYDY